MNFIENNMLNCDNNAVQPNHNFSEDEGGNFDPANRIEEPRENDILLGRGGGTNKHTGNNKLRALVKERHSEYMSSNDKRKEEITKEILNYFLVEINGRFLERKQKGGEWKVVDYFHARKKISQCFRDANREKKGNECKKTIPSQTAASTLAVTVASEGKNTSRDNNDCKRQGQDSFKMIRHEIPLSDLSIDHLDSLPTCTATKKYQYRSRENSQASSIRTLSMSLDSMCLSNNSISSLLNFEKMKSNEDDTNNDMNWDLVITKDEDDDALASAGGDNFKRGNSEYHECAAQLGDHSMHRIYDYDLDMSFEIRNSERFYVEREQIQTKNRNRSSRNLSMSLDSLGALDNDIFRLLDKTEAEQDETNTTCNYNSY